MYRPERVTFFCIGASLVPDRRSAAPSHLFVSQTDTEGVSRTIASIEGLILGREASFKQYQIDISEFRERRFGAEGEGGTDPNDKFGDVFLVVDNFSDLYDKDAVVGDRLVAIARQGPVVRDTCRPPAPPAWAGGAKSSSWSTSPTPRIQLRLSNPDETQMGEGLRAQKRPPATHWTGPGFGGHPGGPRVTGRDARDHFGRRVNECRRARSARSIADVDRRRQAGKSLARLPERIQLTQIVAAVRGYRPSGGPRSTSRLRSVESALQANGFRPLEECLTCWCWAGNCAVKPRPLPAFGAGDHEAVFTPEQAQITIVDPKTSLIGKSPGDPMWRAYAI